MFKLVLLAVVLILVAFMALAVFLYTLWGAWGFLAAAGALVVFLWVTVQIVKTAFKRVFLMPFRAKGAVLKNAQIVVHSVTPCEPPEYEEDEFEDDQDEVDDASEDEDQDDEEDDEPEAWYMIDITIVPEPVQGPFKLWEPGELVLVEMDAEEDNFDDEIGHVDEVSVWQDGGWRPDEEGKYAGSQRVLLQAGVRPDVRQARFRYYFEVFGEVELPPAAL
jgi:hypothetical protein